MTAMTNEARAAIATGWLNSQMKLADYAAQVGVAPRTVRSYVQRHAGRHGDRQVLGPDVGVDIQKLVGDVDRLQHCVDRLQTEVQALHGRLVASAPGDTGRHERSVPDDAGHADPGGLTDTTDEHGKPGRPGEDEPGPPSVDAGAADRHLLVPSITTSTNCPPVGGMPDDIRSSGASKEPRAGKRRTFAELVLEDPDSEEAGPVGDGDGLGQRDLEQHEPDRHAAFGEQATVAPAPESGQTEVERVLPIRMPPPGAICWG